MCFAIVTGVVIVLVLAFLLGKNLFTGQRQPVRAGRMLTAIGWAVLALGLLTVAFTASLSFLNEPSDAAVWFGVGGLFLTLAGAALAGWLLIRLLRWARPAVPDKAPPDYPRPETADPMKGRKVQR